MTQAEKELLLTDLCARARYKVKICVSKGTRINIDGKVKEQDLVDTVYGVIFYNDEPKIVTPQNFSFLDKNGINNFGGWSVEMVKPYLRSMSSMTEEEKNEFIHYAEYEVEESVNGRHYEYCLKDYVGTPEKPFCNYNAIDWLNAHHFDYRGLIEKGLALEAPEWLYKQ